LTNLINEIVEKRKNLLFKDVEKLKKLEKYRPKDDRKPLSSNIKSKSEISLISEIKPASPTAGILRNNINIEEISKEMESAGAIGLSVLTEPNYFHGSYENLQLAIESTNLPCLMKDFIVDEVQFKIARQLGATNILLINSIGNLEQLHQLSIKYKIEPLIEIHRLEEIDDIKRLIEIGMRPKLIGVNNRDLETLNVDLNTSKIIIPKLKEEFGENIKIISESGINTFKDIKFLLSCKADAFLIGSAIMKSNNVKEKILSLRGLS